MTGGGDEAKRFRLFYSYSHDDEDLRSHLAKHLAILRWNGLISEWHDRQIEAGQDWEKEIDRNLCSADIILLLVSPSFIASKYCWSIEMDEALKRHNNGEARVIPVILRQCRWKSTPIAKLQAVPKDGKAVKSWTDLDVAFDDVVENIERVVAKLRRAEEEARRKAAEEARRKADEARQQVEEDKERRRAEEEEVWRNAEAQQRTEAEARRRAEEQDKECLPAQEGESQRRSQGECQRRDEGLPQPQEERGDKLRSEKQARSTTENIFAPHKRAETECNNCYGTGLRKKQIYTGYPLGTITIDEICSHCGGRGWV